MTLKKCPSCQVTQTTKNCIPKGRDPEDIALYFNCKVCQSTFILRRKNWKELSKAKWVLKNNTWRFVATLCLVILALSGCATYQPAVKHFSRPEGKTDSQVVLDQARCGSVNGQHYQELDELYYACMDKLGYKLVIDKAASSSTSYNPLEW